MWGDAGVSRGVATSSTRPRLLRFYSQGRRAGRCVDIGGGPGPSGGPREDEPGNEERSEVVGAPAQGGEHMAGVGAHGGERGVEARAAERVEDDVEPLPAGVPADVLLHRGRGPVDGGRAQLLDGRQGAGRSGREDVRAARPRDLHGHPPDAAGPAVHQPPVPGAHRGPVHQALPGGDHGERQGRGLPRVQRGGPGCRQPGVDRGVLGERAPQLPHAAGEAVHRVSRSQAADPGADPRDHTGQVEPEHGGQPAAGVCGLPRVSRWAGAAGG